MAESKATAKWLRVPPRKARLVADLIRGRKVAEARDILAYTTKNASPLVGKLLESAVANAEHKAHETNKRVDTDEFVVKEIQVNQGIVIPRYHRASRGRGQQIRKRTSHITLTISDS